MDALAVAEMYADEGIGTVSRILLPAADGVLDDGVGLVQKPFSEHELLAAVSAALHAA